jgi:signal transduction histidine kinase
MLQLAAVEDDPQTYLDIIKRSSHRINEMIGNLLQHQLSENVRMEKHSINRLLADVVEMAKDRIILKNISVRKEYGVRGCKVLMNRVKMKIALTNIIINAIDAVDISKGELKISTKLIDGRLAIQIEDNGCGIDKEDLGSIFKPNYSNKPGGLGIGLATTNDILLLNRVKINVESEKGKGTKFILLFEDHSW